MQERKKDETWPTRPLDALADGGGQEGACLFAPPLEDGLVDVATEHLRRL